MSSFFTFDGPRLQQAIFATGLSVPEFAEAAHVDTKTVYRAIAERRVHITKAVAMVKEAKARATDDGQSLLNLQASSRSA